MATPQRQAGGTVRAWVANTVGQLGPSAFGSCPEQMKGSKSRMQGKEVSEQETEGEAYVGIDVCESWLDVHVLPAGKAFRVANTSQVNDSSSAA